MDYKVLDTDIVFRLRCSIELSAEEVKALRQATDYLAEACLHDGHPYYYRMIDNIAAQAETALETHVKGYKL